MTRFHDPKAALKSAMDEIGKIEPLHTENALKLLEAQQSVAEHRAAAAHGDVELVDLTKKYNWTALQIAQQRELAAKAEAQIKEDAEDERLDDKDQLVIDLDDLIVEWTNDLAALANHPDVKSDAEREIDALSRKLTDARVKIARVRFPEEDDQD